MEEPPPPPPPHGEGRPKRGGLPDGNYDIFIVPPYAAGSGFLYLPSLRPNVNSFAAGFASALLLVFLYTITAPAFVAWWNSVKGQGGVMVVIMTAVGVGAWVLGRTQTEGVDGGIPGGVPGGGQPPTGHGRPNAHSAGGGQMPGGGAGPMPGAGSYPRAGSMPRGAPGAGGPESNTSWQRAPGPEPNTSRYSAPDPEPDASWHSSPEPEAPPPPRPQPQAAQPPRPEPQAAQPPRPEPQAAQPPRPEPQAAQPPRPEPQAAQPPRPEPQAAPPPPRPQPQSAPPPRPPPIPKPQPPKAASPPKPPSTAWERSKEETRRKEAERKAKEEAIKVAEAAQKKKEEEDRRRKELVEKMKQAREKEKDEREAREARQKREKEAAEARQKEAREREAREKKEKEEEEKKSRGSSYAFPKVGEKTALWPNGRPQVPTPQDSSQSPSLKPTPTSNAAKPSPAPSPTKEPPRRPPPAPTARTYQETEIDEDGCSYRPYDNPKRPVYRRHSQTSMYSESSYAPSHSTAQTTPPPSRRGKYTNKDPDKIIIKAVYSFNNTFIRTPSSQLLSGVGSVTDGLILRITTEGLFIDDDVRGVAQREWDVKAWTLKTVETGKCESKGLHLVRASIRDAEGKRFLFVLGKEEAWKVVEGLARLRRGSQVRQLGFVGMSDGDAKSTLEGLGWI